MVHMDDGAMHYYKVETVINKSKGQIWEANWKCPIEKSGYSGEIKFVFLEDICLVTVQS